jgi:hypothetical protein
MGGFLQKQPANKEELHSSKLISVVHHLEKEVCNAMKKADSEKELLARHMLGAALDRLRSEPNEIVCSFFTGYLDHSASQGSVYGINRKAISDLESEIRMTYPFDYTPLSIQMGAFPNAILMPNMLSREEADISRAKGREMLELFAKRNDEEILRLNKCSVRPILRHE